MLPRQTSQTSLGRPEVIRNGFMTPAFSPVLHRWDTSLCKAHCALYNVYCTLKMHTEHHTLHCTVLGILQTEYSTQPYTLQYACAYTYGMHCTQFSRLTRLKNLALTYCILHTAYSCFFRRLSHLMEVDHEYENTIPKVLYLFHVQGLSVCSFEYPIGLI